MEKLNSEEKVTNEDMLGEQKTEKIGWTYIRVSKVYWTDYILRKEFT